MRTYSHTDTHRHTPTYVSMYSKVEFAWSSAFYCPAMRATPRQTRWRAVTLAVSIQIQFGERQYGTVDPPTSKIHCLSCQYVNTDDCNEFNYPMQLRNYNRDINTSTVGPCTFRTWTLVLDSGHGIPDGGVRYNATSCWWASRSDITRRRLFHSSYQRIPLCSLSRLVCAETTRVGSELENHSK